MHCFHPYEKSLRTGHAALLRILWPVYKDSTLKLNFCPSYLFF